MALSWGMSYDLYWHGSLNAFYIYREKHRQEQKQIDFNAWINGLYVEKALEAVLDRAFNGKKATAKYPDNPLLVPVKKKSTEDETKLQETKQMIIEHNMIINAMIQERKFKNKKGE